jgi:hypothetical protein
MISSALSSVDTDPLLDLTTSESKLTDLSRLPNHLPNHHSRVAEQRGEALSRVLDKHRGDRHLVILQDFPDPDAISSAWAYKLIAERFDIQCDLVYGGTLSHQENIALVKLTGLPLQRWNCQTAKSKDLSATGQYSHHHCDRPP